jgi:phosphopentomutase
VDLARAVGTINVILVVLDSVGIGDSPDAVEFGTDGSNTLAHVAEYADGLELPAMERLGLGEIYPLLNVESPDSIDGCYGALCERSNAVDSTSGHWEMMGVEVQTPFPTYPEGFPPEVIEPFEEAIDRKALGNRPASGTKIIEELGKEHLETGNPIVYTSADSVFQIAAHEDVIPVDELYEICRTAREILTGEHAVGRVIARPFVGELGSFERTHRRKDFTVPPPARTVLEDLQSAGVPVHAVGKIGQIFSEEGIDETYKAKNNQDSVDQTISLIESLDEDSFIFTNLVDFDMRFGHRNDPAGYADALEEWDRGLEDILAAMAPEDLLLITADHGTDPTTEITDHSRELVPLLAFSEEGRSGVDLGVRVGFQDLGQTVLDAFDLPTRLTARSFLPEMR